MIAIVRCGVFAVKRDAGGAVQSPQTQVRTRSATGQTGKLIVKRAFGRTVPRITTQEHQGLCACDRYHCQVVVGRGALNRDQVVVSRSVVENGLHRFNGNQDVFHAAAQPATGAGNDGQAADAPGVIHNQIANRSASVVDLQEVTRRAHTIRIVALDRQAGQVGNGRVAQVRGHVQDDVVRARVSRKQIVAAEPVAVDRQRVGVVACEEVDGRGVRGRGGIHRHAVVAGGCDDIHEFHGVVGNVRRTDVESTVVVADVCRCESAQHGGVADDITQ